MTRYVEKKILSIEQSEGVGAKVRRSIGTSQVCRLIFVILLLFDKSQSLGTKFRSILNA